MLQVVTVPFERKPTFCREAPGQERAWLTAAPTPTPRRRGGGDVSPARALGEQQGPQISSARVEPKWSPAGLQPDRTWDTSAAETGMELPPAIEHHPAPRQGARVDGEGKLPPLSVLQVHMGEGRSKEGSSCLSFPAWFTYAPSPEECNPTGLHRTALKLV